MATPKKAAAKKPAAKPADEKTPEQLAEEKHTADVAAADAANKEDAKQAKAATPVEKQKAEDVKKDVEDPTENEFHENEVAAEPEKHGAEPDGTYIVQGGEDLLEIANRFSVSVNRLAEINHLHTGYRGLTKGQVIRLYPQPEDGYETGEKAATENA
jgi:LysM repeat protein